MERSHRRATSGLCFSVLVVISLGWFAPSAFGQLPYFLEIEPASRNGAMGYAGVALTGGHNAAFWNPAALSQARSFRVTATRFNPIWYADDVVYEHIAGHIAPSRAAAIGAAVTYLNWFLRLDTSYEIALTNDYRNNDGVRFSVAVAG